MKRSTKIIVTSVILAGAVLAVLGCVVGRPPLASVLFWLLLGLLGEYFWVRTLDGESINSYGASLMLVTVFILGPWSALVVFFGSTLLGNLAFRRSAWYKALYNAGQLAVAGFFAGLVWFAFGGPVMGDQPMLIGGSGLDWLAETLSRPGHILGFLLVIGVYLSINTLLMAVLMASLTGRSFARILEERATDAQEIQGLAATSLTPLLLILIYGAFGILGLALFFFVLALERLASFRTISLLQTQDKLVRVERMAAMGDLAQEVGVSLGDSLEELRSRTSALGDRVRVTGDPKMLQGIGIIDENVDHMKTLIDGITAFSDQEIRLRPLDLNELVERTVEFVRPQNRFDGVLMETFLEADLPEAEMDGGQIQQVVINLLANAADALREAGTPEPRIVVETTRQDRGKLRLTVTDNGPGIPESNLSRIFEPHFTTKETGHGFGLATSFKILTHHGGSIEAENVPNGGACFTLRLPPIA